MTRDAPIPSSPHSDAIKRPQEYEHNIVGAKGVSAVQMEKYRTQATRGTRRPKRSASELESAHRSAAWPA